jgi:hypothetical protein
MKKSQNMPVWLRKMVVANIIAHLGVDGKRYSNIVHMQKRVLYR